LLINIIIITLGIITIVRDDYTDLLLCPEEPYHPTDRPLDSIHHYNNNDQMIIINQQTIKSMLRKISIEVTIHGIANAESYAIDLFWDLIARYTHLSSMRRIDSSTISNDNDELDLDGNITRQSHAMRASVTEYLLPIEFFNGNGRS